jgi:hypothetical protein
LPRTHIALRITRARGAAPRLTRSATALRATFDGATRGQRAASALRRDDALRKTIDLQNMPGNLR